MPDVTGLIVLAVVVGIALSAWLTTIFRRYDARLQARIAEQERLNTALEQFAARAAHDLRNPLATMRMAVDMLAREEVSDNARMAVEVLERQTVRALDLIDGLLALAKATGTPSRELIDIGPVVATVAADLEDLTVDVSAGGTVIADRISFGQVVTNLLENAARYGRHDGSAARVEVARAETSEGWTVSFSDGGPGVPEAEQQRVFKAFERGTTATGTGTGLGLAIVKTVAEAHGGRAWYEPGAQGGAVFKVFLPRQTGAAGR